MWDVRYETVCHTGTSLVGSNYTASSLLRNTILVCREDRQEASPRTLVLQIVLLSDYLKTFAIALSLAKRDFHPACTRKRLLAGLCPDSLQRRPGTANRHKVKGRKGRKETLKDRTGRRKTDRKDETRFHTDTSFFHFQTIHHFSV